MKNLVTWKRAKIFGRQSEATAEADRLNLAREYDSNGRAAGFFTPKHLGIGFGWTVKYSCGKSARPLGYIPCDHSVDCFCQLTD